MTMFAWLELKCGPSDSGAGNCGRIAPSGFVPNHKQQLLRYL